jgi:hypothetical protein
MKDLILLRLPQKMKSQMNLTHQLNLRESLMTIQILITDITIKI